MNPCPIKIVRLMLSVGTVWFVTGTAHAGAPALPPPVSEPTPSESPFEASIGFPVWIPFPEGDVGARLPSGGEGVLRGVDRVSGHIRPLKNLGAFGYIIPLSIELQKSRWLLQASGYYLNLSASVDPHGPLYRSGTLDWNSGLVDVALGYRVLEIPCFSLDLLAGGRYQHVGLNFSLQPRANRLVPRSASDSKDWADPFVRVVGKARLARPVTLFLKGDIGGFGVSSDLTWTVYGGFEFQIARHFYADIGCRYFGTDYSSGSFKYNVNLIGPQLELGANF
jgi:hypothetical protein